MTSPFVYEPVQLRLMARRDQLQALLEESLELPPINQAGFRAAVARELEGVVSELAAAQTCRRRRAA